MQKEGGWRMSPCPGVQLATSPIVNDYRKLCWAIKIFVFVARLAIKKGKILRSCSGQYK